MDHIKLKRKSIKLNFLTSSLRAVGKFGIKVKEGKVTESEFDEIFEKIKKKNILKKKQLLLLKIYYLHLLSYQVEEQIMKYQVMKHYYMY